LTVFVFIIGIFKNYLLLGFLLSSTSNATEKIGKGLKSEAAPSFPKNTEKYEILEKEMEFFRENFKLLQTKLQNLEKQNLKSVQSVEETFKSSMKQELKQERERIDKLLLDSLTKTSHLQNSEGGKIDYSVVSDLINTRISKELEGKLLVDHEKLPEMINTHMSGFRPQMAEEKPSVYLNGDFTGENWALRSMGTRIYRLGTTQPYTQKVGWRGWLESACRPTKLQSPVKASQKGDCWCIRGKKGKITFAFNQAISIGSVNIVQFYGEDLQVDIFGKNRIIGLKDDLLYTGSAHSKINIEQSNQYKYLRIEFERRNPEIDEKTCIYRIQIFSPLQ
jgi:hypothetical protein